MAECKATYTQLKAMAKGVNKLKLLEEPVKTTARTKEQLVADLCVAIETIDDRRESKELPEDCLPDEVIKFYETYFSELSLPDEDPGPDDEDLAAAAESDKYEDADAQDAGEGEGELPPEDQEQAGEGAEGDPPEETEPGEDPEELPPEEEIPETWVEGEGPSETDPPEETEPETVPPEEPEQTEPEDEGPEPEQKAAHIVEIGIDDGRIFAVQSDNTILYPVLPLTSSLDDRRKSVMGWLDSLAKEGYSEDTLSEIRSLMQEMKYFD